MYCINKLLLLHKYNVVYSIVGTWATWSSVHVEVLSMLMNADAELHAASVYEKGEVLCV